MIHPVDADDYDTLAIADTKDEAVARCRQMHKWNHPNDDAPIVMVQRDGIPLWFAHAVKNTWFERLAYYEAD